MLGSPECPAEQMTGKSESVENRTPGSAGANTPVIDFSLRLPFQGFPPSFLFFLHCITLNRAAGVLPVVSSLKKCISVPEKKGSVFRKSRPGWEEGGCLFVCGRVGVFVCVILVWFRAFLFLFLLFFYKHSVASCNVSNYRESPLPLQV